MCSAEMERLTACHESDHRPFGQNDASDPIPRSGQSAEEPALPVSKSQVPMIDLSTLSMSSTPRCQAWRRRFRSGSKFAFACRTKGSFVRKRALLWTSLEWRGTARLAAATALLTLIINIGALGWAVSRIASPTGSSWTEVNYSGNKGILRQIYKGDCGTVEKINTWVHLAIKILSTALLSGSNYCMQCLSAPTREETDRAHADGKWLDIGVYSIRNLSSIPQKKKWLWWVLGLSSIPLHLLINSALYISLSAVPRYDVLFIKEDFLTTANQTALSAFETLDNARCIAAYASISLTDRRDVLVICEDEESFSNELDYSYGGYRVLDSEFSKTEHYGW